MSYVSNERLGRFEDETDWKRFRDTTFAQYSCIALIQDKGQRKKRAKVLHYCFAVEIRKTWVTKRTPFWKQWRQSNDNKAPDSFVGRMDAVAVVKSPDRVSVVDRVIFNVSMNWLIIWLTEPPLDHSPSSKYSRLPLCDWCRSTHDQSQQNLEKIASGEKKLKISKWLQWNLQC